MKKADMGLGAAMLAFAFLGWLETASWPAAQSGGLSASTYPRAVFLMIALCGAYIASKAFWGKTSGGAPSLRFSKLLPVASLLAAYALSLEYLGFVVPTETFLLLSMFAFGLKNLKENIIISTLGTAALYVVFILLLQVQF
jgi:hypothetical protein